MKKSTIVLLITLSFVFNTSTIYAKSDIETLTPELRALLKNEMLLLQKGMESILPAYISGDLKEISKIASKIKNSYILKQNISNAQKHELMTKLEKSFLKNDAKFHEYAGMLEHVAKEKHLELVGFYYSKLIESCVSCHSDFANHRFPELKTHQQGHH